MGSDITGSHNTFSVHVFDYFRFWLVQPSTIVTAILVAGAAICATYMATRENYKKQKKILPPGPPGHWLYGNYKEMDQKHPQKKLLEWTKQYGHIYTIYIYHKPVVVINSEAGLREALVTKSNDFAGRPSFERLKYIIQDIKAPDMAILDIGPTWNAIKKSFITAIKVTGERSVLESLTQEHVANMCDIFLSHNDQPFDPIPYIHHTISNIMYNLCFSKEISKEAMDQLLPLHSTVALVVSAIGNGTELEVWPWLKYFNNPWYKVMKKARHYVNTWVDREFDAWKKEFDPQNPKCVMDTLMINQMNSNILTENHVKAMLFDLASAGIATTMSTVACLLPILGSHPEVQKKLQAEADRVLGSRLPSLKDKEHMHYTEATLLELMRLLRVSGMAHKTMCDTSVCGHPIPKDTEVWMMYWNQHRDEANFPNSAAFIPDRFIDENGVFVSNDHPIRRRVFAFGAGRRICAGEQIAKNRTFLILATLMQRLTILPQEGTTLPSDPREYTFGLTLMPPAYKICAISRK